VTWRNSGNKSLNIGRKYQGSTSLHTRYRHSQTLAVIMIRQVWRKSNFRQVVAEQRYGQLYLHIQRRTDEIQIQNTETSQHSCPTVCYRPAVFFWNLRLIVRSFSQRITRRAFKNIYYSFFTFQKLLVWICMKWNCIGLGVPVYGGRGGTVASSSKSRWSSPCKIDSFY
jgi:hypothetical protein